MPAAMFRQANIQKVSNTIGNVFSGVVAPVKAGMTGLFV
jgi:hypothetical protein